MANSRKRKQEHHFSRRLPFTPRVSFEDGRLQSIEKITGSVLESKSFEAAMNYAVKELRKRLDIDDIPATI